MSSDEDSHLHQVSHGRRGDIAWWGAHTSLPLVTSPNSVVAGDGGQQKQPWPSRFPGRLVSRPDEVQPTSVWSGRARSLSSSSSAPGPEVPGGEAPKCLHVLARTSQPVSPRLFLSVSLSEEHLDPGWNPAAASSSSLACWLVSRAQIAPLCRGKQSP